MSISTPFINRPVATTLLMAAILLVGIAAYPLLPVAPLPRVEFPTIQVTAALPGASPETMASTVAQPLERQFAQISGVAQMTSISVGGSTQVVVQFDLDRNIDAASLDVQAAINNAGGQLPKNLPNPPLFRKVNPADSPILILAVQSETLPLIEVNDYADNILSQQISQISGVEWQPAGLINDGFIRFTVAGTVAQHGRLGSQATAARFDPWAVPFFRKQQASFEALRDAIEQARRGTAAPGPDVAGQLVQLAQLLDRGLLSRAEFDHQKAQLLTGR